VWRHVMLKISANPYLSFEFLMYTYNCW
jgi:hypothetical protein